VANWSASDAAGELEGWPLPAFGALLCALTETINAALAAATRKEVTRIASRIR
jgi:hypothetical protein